MEQTQFPLVYRKPWAYAVLSFVIGPFSAMLVNYWIGVMLLSLPVIIVLGVGNLSEPHDVLSAELRMQILKVSAVGYWLLCSIAAYVSARWYNRWLNSLYDANKSMTPISNKMRDWLLTHPEADVNDYYDSVRSNGNLRVN